MKFKYIFIVGSSRSGTTMMSRVFNQHSSIYTFKEIHFFNQIYKKYNNKKIIRSSAIDILSELFQKQKDGLFSKINSKNLKDLASKLLSKEIYEIIEVFKIFVEFELNDKNKLVACFHTPNNIYYINDIINAFPNAKFINMVRDNRDVLMSQKNKWKRKFLGAKKIPFIESIRSYVNYHPITTSLVWNSTLKITRGLKQKSNVFVLKFEDFVLAPEKKCKRLCDFLQIDYEPIMLEIKNIGSSNTNDSQEKLIDVSKIYKWKKNGLTNSEIYLAQLISSSFMNDFNYEKKKFNFPPFYVVIYLLIFPVKLFFAFIFNLNRMYSIHILLNQESK